MKIYTRAGDNGDTGLYGGQRVSKDDLRVESYGAVDEANAALGVAAAHITDNELQALVAHLQSDLFVVGADLATPLSRDEPGGKAIVPRIEAKHTDALEAIIDKCESELAPLRNFILPGGDPGSAYLHLARTIIRRAERRTVTLVRSDGADTNEAVIAYLNRLADLVFVLARLANHRAGVGDIAWTRE